MTDVKLVRLQARRNRNTVQYMVTVPKEYVTELGLEKGQILKVRVAVLEEKGEKKKVLLYEPVRI